MRDPSAVRIDKLDEEFSLHRDARGKNAHIYISAFRNESRILRQTAAIAASGRFGKIYILGGWEPDLPILERLDRTRIVVRIRTLTRRGRGLWNALVYAEWLLRCTSVLLRIRPGCLNAHSVRVLPSVMMVRILRRKCVLVYDTHEWETGTDGLAGMKRLLWILVERAAIPFIHSIVTVTDGITLLYRTRYPQIPVTTVRNFPLKRGVVSRKQRKERLGLRGYCCLNDADILFCFQGMLRSSRYIELLIEVFSHITSGKHLVLMGWGPLQRSVETAAKAYHNIHFHPGVSPECVIEYIMGADVGISLTMDNCLNHHHSLPNKVLESLGAGIPVIVSDLPELRRVVEAGRYGWTIPSTAEALANLVRSLDRRAIERKAAAVQSWSDTHNWETESRIYLDALAAYRTE